MPAISQAQYFTLRAVAATARVSFLHARLRPEGDCEAYANTTFARAMASSDAAHPEALASLADAYLTALSGSGALPDLRALGGLASIHAALGTKVK